MPGITQIPLSNGFGKETNHHNASENQDYPQNRGKVQMLFVEKKSRQRHKDNANPRPDSVGNPQGNGFESEGKNIKGKRITENHNNRRNQSGKAFRGFKG